MQTILLYQSLERIGCYTKHNIMKDLSTHYLGIKLKNPIIIGSSGLTDTVEKIKTLEQNGAAAVVLKSLFEEEIIFELEEDKHKMTSRFYIYPETYDYMDHEELYKEDLVRQYLRLISEAKAAVDIPIIASINCVSDQKWTYLAKEIEKAGADALELNLFILPSDLNRSAETNTELYFQIIEAVKEEVNIPIALKISYYFTNLAEIIQKLSATGIKGLVLFNRFYSPDFDIENFVVTPSNVLSSPASLTIPLRWIAIMANRVSCDLAASTGIHNGEAIIKQLLAGATAVQITSAIYNYGPELIPKLLSTLESWMDRHDFRKIEDFKGMMSQSNSLDPASYERVQFMKYFRSFSK